MFFYLGAELIPKLLVVVYKVSHIYTYVDLLQNCCDYLSHQGTSAETVWNDLISRVHLVGLVFILVFIVYYLSISVRVSFLLVRL